MRRFWLATLMVSILFWSAGVSSQQETEKPPRNIILIGWDGAQRNHVKECLSRGELPNLKQLGSEGALVAIDINRVTDTKAGWTQILTGYEPEITGVYSNARFQPIPRGLTVFERLEEHFGKNNFVTVAVIGKKGNVDCEGPQKVLIPKVTQRQGKKAQVAKRAQRAEKQLQRIMAMEGKVIEEKGKQYKLIPGKPYYYTRESMDVFINGLMTDERVGSKTLSLLEHYKDKPFFFFVHFAEIDHQGHQHGENSKQYIDALKSADRWLGNIVRKLKELG
ncbi:MAG: alkaline phosphatase family protein, partial [Candidatus Sumerlaeia bacterium]|nr:alkaline phosphatase family protein [Candidatus Sumerlaeia bacterium]